MNQNPFALQSAHSLYTHHYCFLRTYRSPSQVLDSLSSYLTEEYGRGFSRSNVAGMRQFYMAYKDREDEIIQLGIGQFEQDFGIGQSGIGQLETAYKKIPFKLSWTHYQILMRIEDKDERDFYEKGAIRSNWNVSTLKRQFHSSLYERLPGYVPLCILSLKTSHCHGKNAPCPEGGKRYILQHLIQKFPL